MSSMAVTPKLDQIFKIGDDCIESARRRESADMQLVDDVIFKRQTGPALIVPTKLAVDHLRRTMNTFRLKTRRRVGALGLSVSIGRNRDRRG